MDIVKALSDLDDRPELHIARLLILISKFSDPTTGDSIEGLTKLAKLDFLLRYPVMLERALTAKNRSTKDVKLEEHEMNSVESEMVRYRFGPWDHRYREFLNILVSKGLIKISIEGRKVVFLLTKQGQSIALQLSESPDFLDYSRRSALLKRHFDIQATNLMKFIYKTFPEVVSLRSNERIPT